MSCISGRSVGTLADSLLEEREWERKCSPRDRRFSPLIEVLDEVDVLEELRRREKWFER